VIPLLHNTHGPYLSASEIQLYKFIFYFSYFTLVNTHTDRQTADSRLCYNLTQNTFCKRSIMSVDLIITFYDHTGLT